MVKLFLTYSNVKKDGYESLVPYLPSLKSYATESVEDISGEDVLEKVEDLPAFMDEVYRVLAPGAKAYFTSPHYGSARAWQSPIARRGVSEASLNFTNKAWRDHTGWCEAQVTCNFEVNGQLSVEQECLNRSEDAKNFWLRRFLNVAQSVIYTLTKI